MINEQIQIINKFGIHTRAAAKLVAIAAKFESTIEIQHNNQIANCKSIMALIVMGITRGMTLDLLITGADELEARDAVVKLINERFGEAE